MVKKLFLCLMMLSGSVMAHNDVECVVCSGHQYEFEGDMNTLKAQQNFWRVEEQACEKLSLAALRAERENVSPRARERLNAELDDSKAEQEKRTVVQKLTVLKSITKRLSKK